MTEVINPPDGAKYNIDHAAVATTFCSCAAVAGEAGGGLVGRFAALDLLLFQSQPFGQFFLAQPHWPMVAQHYRFCMNRRCKAA